MADLEGTKTVDVALSVISDLRLDGAKNLTDKDINLLLVELDVVLAKLISDLIDQSTLGKVICHVKFSLCREKRRLNGVKYVKACLPVNRKKRKKYKRIKTLQ